jgi:hypothetical protein
MAFTYIPAIPAAANNPSIDQPNMQTNTNSISNWTAVDHIGFNTIVAGQHKQVTFNNNNPPGAPPVGNTSILYTNPGTADPAHPQMFWQNANATFHFPIRAWGNLAAGAIVTTQGFNIGVVVKNAVGNYSVVLSAGAVNSVIFAVIATSALAGGSQTCINVAPTAPGVFQAFIRIAGTPTLVDAQWSFMVLQI